MSIVATVHVLIAIHLIFTLSAYYSVGFRARHTLGTQPVLVGRGYARLWTTSFVHTDGWYFLLNSLVLLWFGHGVEKVMSVADFLLLYSMSVLGGSLITLYVCRRDAGRRDAGRRDAGRRDADRYDKTAEAVGAAGGISGFIFASIALFPSLSLPLPGGVWGIPAGPVAVLFVAVSVLGPRWYFNTMRHEAQLGGALTGLLVALLLAPETLRGALWVAVGILAPTVTVFYLYVRRPATPTVRAWSAFEQAYPWTERETSYTNIEEEIDSLLDRISEIGYQNLSDYEKERLRYISGGVRA